MRLPGYAWPSASVGKRHSEAAHDERRSRVSRAEVVFALEAKHALLFLADRLVFAGGAGGRDFPCGRREA
jgi:hypothetical protein